MGAELSLLIPRLVFSCRGVEEVLQHDAGIDTVLAKGIADFLARRDPGSTLPAVTAGLIASAKQRAQLSQFISRWPVPIRLISRPLPECHRRGLVAATAGRRQRTARRRNSQIDEPARSVTPIMPSC